ncbi:MAG: nitrile hydratase subunit alpha [Alcanivorax sp.]|nr:nitrile hydratase subunit alpha [Alcanivorax sp.]
MSEISLEMYRRHMATIISRAWLDTRYREALQKNPHKMLQEAGIPVNEKIKINVHFNSPNEFNLIIPDAPDAKSITESDFVAASAQVAAHEQLILPTIFVKRHGW